VLVKRAALLNGLDHILLTKLDVLGHLPEIKICYGYEGDLLVGDFPHTADEMQAMRPRYTTMPGWQTDLRACRTREDLPAAAKHYIAKVEELVGVRIAAVSVGPGREETIEL
jgi:adenylosuccinate synthase